MTVLGKHPKISRQKLKSKILSFINSSGFETFIKNKIKERDQSRFSGNSEEVQGTRAGQNEAKLLWI
ncbi:MAG: hypothetical protein Q9N34_06915 [Aquificota bacterium]|nr:hypothetical protein [Aquificota bacterium]